MFKNAIKFIPSVAVFLFWVGYQMIGIVIPWLGYSLIGLAILLLFIPGWPLAKRTVLSLFGRPSPSRVKVAETKIEATQNSEDEHDRLMESLNLARVGAEALLKLPSDTDIGSGYELTTPPAWAEVLEIKKAYRDTIKTLEQARAAYGDHKDRINSLINSLQRARSLINRYKRRTSLSEFKTELDTNSTEVIKQIDDVLTELGHS